jgi:hypothetical protein
VRQDRADALLDDWTFHCGRREDVVRKIAQAQPPIGAALLVAVYIAGRDPRVPWYAKLAVVAVAAYALSPSTLSRTSSRCSAPWMRSLSCRSSS